MKVTGALVWLSVKWGEGWVGKGAGGTVVYASQNVSGLCLVVEKETTTSNNWTGCNYKVFRSHTFMTATKNDQLCYPRILCPTPYIYKREQ